MLGLLFLQIYVNNIHDVASHSTTNLFADDAVIIQTIATSGNCILLQEGLKYILYYFLGKQIVSEIEH